jgi:hypothetical protein
MPSSVLRHSLLAVLGAGLAAGATVLGPSVLGAASAATRGHAAAAPTPPAVVSGTLIKPQPGTPAAGTTVPAKDLGQRYFTSSSFGVALAGTGQSQSPAVTTNGGKTWTLNGPALHLDAAQAPLVVVYMGAVNRRTLFAYGGGQTVDATGDGGKHWYRAILGDLVAAVVPGFQGQLIAFVQSSAGNTAVTWQYVSKNGGKTWRYDSNLGGS